MAAPAPDRNLDDFTEEEALELARGLLGHANHEDVLRVVGMLLDGPEVERSADDAAWLSAVAGAIPHVADGYDGRSDDALKTADVLRSEIRRRVRGYD